METNLITKTDVANGIIYVTIPEVDLRILCGCPADSVKHLMKKGLIVPCEKAGMKTETGPNSILLSDVMVQHGSFSNLAEFPVLQMLYRQGMLIPDHPNNTGEKPLIIGSIEQVRSQMEYIYRGNYGLISMDEIMAAGVPEAEAAEMMRLKLRFAFGRIKPTEELLKTCVVGNDQIEIRDGVFIRRLRVNVFRIYYKNQSVIIDLNLNGESRFQSAYPLGYSDIDLGYFAVIHSGEGDGWDTERPTMSSIVMFQGKLYMIDAGPNVRHSLDALGISIGEIEGIFHTHAHDDHFCGITTLMQSDKRIKYYSTPLVRSSVMKKLSALLSTEESEFFNFFDVHDLVEGRWNDIESLEVKPVYSPHPVETNVFLFRTSDGSRYHTYAHFADIASFEVLQKMVTADPKAPGITADYFESVVEKYLTAVDLKKLDIGGGMIHGKAEDFKDDESDKIMLSHTALELTPSQKEIGSGAPFGMVDVLIPSHQDYLRKRAFHCLGSYYPNTEKHQLDSLMNHPIVSINPETIIYKIEDRIEHIHVVIGGSVERIDASRGVSNLVPTGAIIYEPALVQDVPCEFTYRAMNYVKALKVPLAAFRTFAAKSGIVDSIKKILERRAFLKSTWLFGDSISYPVQNAIARGMTVSKIGRGTLIRDTYFTGVGMVKSGKLQLIAGNSVVDEIGPRMAFAESTALFGTKDVYRIRAEEDTVAYVIPAELIKEIPVVRWKLLETYNRRTKLLSGSGKPGVPFFEWRSEYTVHNDAIDEHHRELFNLAENFFGTLSDGSDREKIALSIDTLIEYANSHFRKEEKLMEIEGFPDLAEHKVVHASLREEAAEFRSRILRNEALEDEIALDFFRNWLVNHNFGHDRKFAEFMKSKGGVSTLEIPEEYAD
ncbi:MAG: bacteriohemerythrin [Planctomycetes bacterium]|nr:bacteriohemerythrin [Planctomycetota bacterium]